MILLLLRQKKWWKYYNTHLILAYYMPRPKKHYKSSYKKRYYSPSYDIIPLWGYLILIIFPIIGGLIGFEAFSSVLGSVTGAMWGLWTSIFVIILFENIFFDDIYLNIAHIITSGLIGFFSLSLDSNSSFTVALIAGLIAPLFTCGLLKFIENEEKYGKY